ncbi:MAG: extracellular solute-binding protein [Lachnospiraceae bacterium]|nr:extracellular solute-binding protein [Lachnospiraceae bacterium]
MKSRTITVFLILILISMLNACNVSSNNHASDDEKITIRLAAPQNAYIENFDTNFYKLWLEEQTQLKIEMTWLPAEDAERLAMLALATGEDLPDAYVGFGSSSFDIFSNLNLQRYAESGVIIPLNDLIDEYGVNLKAVWEELSGYNMQSFTTMPDGNIYYMPGFSSSLITRYIHQVMWVNKGWLDALDIPVPETTDEFREMLLKFKNNDPNSNGIADEIPLVGTEEHYCKQVYDFIFNAFIYNDARHDRLLLENGIVGFAPIRDEWREALKYMNELYEDGLISPFSFTQSNQQHMQMVNDPQDIVGAFASPGITFTVLQNSPEMMARYIGIGPIGGPDGTRLASVSIPLPKPNGVITSAAKHPDKIFQLFDLMLSEEACLIGRYGELNVDWRFAFDDEVSILDTPATINIINQIWNTPQNKTLNQIIPYISRPKFSGGVTWSGNATDGEYLNAKAVMLYRDFEPNEYIGAMIFTAEEEERISVIRPEIKDFVRQSIIDFISGTRDIDSDEEWADYLGTFAALKLDILIETAQAVYDRSGA